MKSSVKITFQPDNSILFVPTGTTVKDAAIQAGLLIDFPCGGQGQCGKCTVTIKESSCLACQTKITEDTVVVIPENINPDRKKSLAFIRQEKYSFDPIIKKPAPHYGLALDIGTTSVAGSLTDLTDGTDLVTVSEENRQAVYGADLISRIGSSLRHQEGLNQLQGKIIEVINRIVGQLVKETSIDQKNINDVTIVGNTVMQHLLLGARVESLAALPFEPVIKGAVDIKAAELKIDVNQDANIYVFPNLDGFVGGDTVGLILALDLHRSDKINLAIDIGTNGEIVLGSKNGLVCTSTAAGPAFEGVRINCGSRAKSGAIESVRFTEQGIFCQTIGGVPAEGICGSGLIDLLAGFLQVGVINQTGKLKTREELVFDKKLSDNLVIKNDQPAFILMKEQNREIIVTQQDIRELQLAKAAIFSGIQILKKQLKVADKDIDRMFIGGTFGNYINKKNAQAIGLIPDIPLEKVIFAGNTALAGAKLALTSRVARQEVAEVLMKTRSSELAHYETFQDEFAQAMHF